MESKVGTMRDKEMDASKRTLKKRQMPHQRGGSNTGSLRTPKNTHNYLGGERGWSAVKSLPSQKYDIATLMAIGKNGGMNSIVSRFSSHSVENNIARRDASPGDRVLTEKRTNRTRGASRGTVGNEDEYAPAQESNLKYPCRQPQNAPQGQLAQTNTGFARFLKQHASPKHQRVTAGGRIVPMGPESPAPEFHLPKNILDQDDNNTERKSSTAYLSSESSSFGAFSNETRPTTQSDPRSEANSKNNHGQTRSETPGYTQAGSISGTTKVSVQHQVPPLIQMPQNMIPLSLLQSHMPSAASLMGYPQPTSGPQTGSTFNGNEQDFSSGRNLNQQYFGPQYVPIFTQQPIQGMLNTQLGNITGMFQPMPNIQMPISSGMYQVPGVGGQSAPQVQAMMNTAQNSTAMPQDPAVNNAFVEVTREYESLSDQLANLDRYLALHTWDIDPATKRALVDQRKYLVVKIDSARTNKELLEASLNSFRLGVFAGAQNNPGQYFQLGQSQSQSSDGITGPGFQPPFWNLNIAPHHGSQVCGSNTIASTPAPTHSFSNAAFTPGAPAQDIVHGQPQCGAPTMEEQHPFLDNSQYNSTEDQRWDNQQNFIDKGLNNDGYRSSMANNRDNPEEGGDWCTPKRPAPPEVSQVYSRIEEAAKRGVTVEKLLEDLALVTAKLNESQYGGDNATSIRQLQSVIERWDPKSQNRLAHDRRDSRHSQSLSEPNIVDGDVPAQQRVPPQTFPHHSPMTADGKGGATMAEPHKLHRARVEDAGEIDDDEGSCYSDGSTNSWATIEVGDKRWLAREKSKEDPKSVEKPRNQERLGQRTGLTDKEGNIASPGDVKTVKPKRSGGSRTVSLRQTTEWVESVNSVENGQHIHDQTPLQYCKSQRHTSDSQAEGSPKQGRSINKQNNKRNDIFALGPWSCGPETSQKVGTSTGFQNVNAHAFLPPFDGAGDTASLAKDNGTHTSSKATATEPPERWYMKPQREIPNPMEVRKFFQSIEQEERVMIEKYRTRRPF